jgi:hypothetical protein
MATEIWTTSTKRGTRYYFFSTSAGRVLPIAKLEALAKIANGDAELVTRPDFLPAR